MTHAIRIVGIFTLLALGVSLGLEAADLEGASLVGSASALRACVPGDYACAYFVGDTSSETCWGVTNSPPIGPGNWGAIGHCDEWVGAQPIA